MLKRILNIAIVLFLTLLCVDSFAQDSESENARTALKAGSSKELAAMLDNASEVIILEKKYTKKNAEPVLKDFFISNPAVDFKFIHNGSSKDGSLVYSIGHYETKNSKFRVVIRFKRSREEFKIHKLEVSKF
ncbi:DUF4783 domain-containing protein [Hyphobacterium sp. CCMP332]|nr:DUF4783 domain-containing protein [Hyphobacterium sp. CCMP332]